MLAHHSVTSFCSHSLSSFRFSIKPTQSHANINSTPRCIINKWTLLNVTNSIDWLPEWSYFHALFPNVKSSLGESALVPSPFFFWTFLESENLTEKKAGHRPISSIRTASCVQIGKKFFWGGGCLLGIIRKLNRDKSLSK